ncbi:MAG TPA: hypothetical protein VEO58_07885 [Gemmatimonadales bacterium]|nr:hypothetical protein [Gemmatimonadales bacterium]
MTPVHARRLAYLAGTIALGCGGAAPIPLVPPRGYYTAPSGSTNGDGTLSSPWSLSTALLGGNGAVRPGDTIWLRGGTYSGEFTSTLTGSGRSPIIVRGLSGERATIDGRLNVFGADAVYWGLELMQSDPVATGEDALDATGPSKQFINLVIHDAGKQGFSFYDAGGVSELYGSIIYNNGTHEEFDHGVYAVNDAGTKYIRDNIIFNNLAYGIHVFATPDHSVLADVHVEGNVSFNNGSISTHGMAKSNLVMGGDQPTKGMHALDNRLYFAAGATGSNARFGVAGQANEDVELRNNYVVGGATALQLESWQSATVQNNTWLGAEDMVYLTAAAAAAAPAYTWGGNTWYRDPAASAWRYEATPYSFDAWRTATGLGASDQTTQDGPTGQAVFVQANQYEPGRAHIIVYNWSGEATTLVNVSGLLHTGDHYEVHNAQDFFGVPVTTGTYDGSPIVVSMAGVNPPVPLGRSTPTPPKTAPFFDVFVLTRTP